MYQINKKLGISVDDFEKSADYYSKDEYNEYIMHKIGPSIKKIPWISNEEPDYYEELINWNEFDYDVDKIKYLIEIIWKYNYQNELRLSKSISTLLHVIK